MARRERDLQSLLLTLTVGRQRQQHSCHGWTPQWAAGFEAEGLSAGRLGEELQVKQIPHNCPNLEDNSGTALIFSLKSL